MPEEEQTSLPTQAPVGGCNPKVSAGSRPTDALLLAGFTEGCLHSAPVLYEDPAGT